MKNMKVLAYIMIVVLVVGCNNRNNKAEIVNNDKSVVEINHDEIINNQEQKFEDIYSVKRCLPLETNGACLIECVEKIITTDEAVIIYDEKQKSVLLFDKQDGHFISKIAALGKGPKEYLDIDGVDYDEIKKRIAIFDPGQARIQYYNLSGEFCESVSFDRYNSGRNFILVDDQTYFYRNLYYSPMKDKGAIAGFVKNDSLKFYRTFFEIPKGLRDFHMNFDPSWCKYDDKLYFRPLLSDTLYEIDGDVKKPFLSFNFPEQTTRINKKIKSNSLKFADANEFIAFYMSNGDYIYDIECIMLDDYLYCEFLYNGLVRTLIYSRNTGARKVFAGLHEGEKGEQRGAAIAADYEKKGIVGYREAKEAQSLFPNFLGENINPDDNPVIVFYKINEF